jgi:murein DD-endopeptidase MepM/ murein hydrolase activator NlpD
MNVFVAVSVGAILLISITTYIIAFTPLREYIPGYASTELKRNATELAIKSDSLATIIKSNEQYLSSIKKVLTGDLEFANLNRDSIVAADLKAADKNELDPSADELQLREDVAREDKYNLFEKATTKAGVVLFPPVKGMVTERYNLKARHNAIDIALPKNTPIKSILNGTIIFADWTPSTGHVIIVRHNSGFISIYKHGSSLTKSVGDVVKAGEVIALAGSTGSESTGVHLHFELWKDGYPVDPENFIEFE